MHFDEDFNKILYNFGKSMIYDDRSDLGFGTYRNRNNHKYNGVVAPHHPSPFHHWMLGSSLVLFSQLMSLANVAKEAAEIANSETMDNE